MNSAITDAKIGRSMKKLDRVRFMAPSASGADRGRGARRWRLRRGRIRLAGRRRRDAALLRLDLLAGHGALKPADDHLVLRRQTAANDAQAAVERAELD